MFSSLKSLGALNHYFVKYKYHVLGGLFFVAISNYFRVLQPQYFREAMDMVTETIPLHNLVKNSPLESQVESFIVMNLIWFGLFVIAQAIIMGVFMYFMRQTIIVMSRLVEYDMRKELYNHAQVLDSAYYKKHTTGDLMAKITEDVSRVRQYLGPTVLYGFNLITLFVLVIYAMFEVNSTLAIYSLLPLPFLSYAIYKVSVVINRKSAEIQNQLSELSASSVEVVSGIRVVKAYVQEERMAEYFDKQSKAYFDANLSRSKVDASFFPIMSLVIGVSTLIVLWVGGNQVVAGEVTPGNIAEFFIYITLLTWPITALGWTASLVQQAAASQTRINDFLATKPSFVNGNIKTIPTGKDIVFDAVSLIYPETGFRALSDISLTIKAGKKTAIIGETGSGKSSIVYLLMQMYQPNTGQIIYDDKDIKDYDLNIWRKKIGYVPQDSFLFSDSVSNNIAFGSDHEVEQDEIIKFAGYASVDNDIKSLPQGYETVVGERGVTLSGGQKQRISIARALINKPDILILDNSLSAVDTETEVQISSYLNQNAGDKTMIFVTQRLNTIFDFDQIIAIADGKVIESGNHDTLMAQKGYYYNIYTKQNELHAG